MSDLENAWEKSEILSERQRMEFSDALLIKPFENSDVVDKIFCLGKVSRQENRWTVSVERGTPTVALNQKTKDQFALTDSPTVAEMRAKTIYPELSLVSGGSFLWLHDHKGERLICLKRDSAAPVDAGFLTCPAGRSGEPLTRTVIGETNEELIIIKTLHGSEERFKLLGFFKDENSKNDIARSRLVQVKKIHDSLKARGLNNDAELLLKIRGEDDVEMLPIEKCLVSEPNTEEVVTIVRNREIDHIQNAVVLFDTANNTLEVNQVLRVALPEESEIYQVMDGEMFGREIRTFNTFSELSNEKLVPALRNYRDRNIKE